jgi:predicted translin family RNA/ssDNA-binding protein
MIKTMDSLFSCNNYDDKTILEIVKSNDFKYVSSIIKTHELNLYISEETNELEHNEVEQLRRFSCKNLETVLLNFQKILSKFNRYQADKKGNFALYFKFYDGSLFSHPVAFETIVEDEEKLHPVFNNVFISSMYILRCLAAYYFGKMDYSSKVLEFLLRQGNDISSQMEYIFRQTAIEKIRKEINQQYDEIAGKIDALSPLIMSFLTNIMDCMTRNNSCDVEYLATYPDQIFGIIQSLCKLPKNEMVKYYLDSCMVKLYLNSGIPKLVRFDIFNCITKNRELLLQLIREIEIVCQPGILLNDTVDFGRCEEHLIEFIASIKCLRVYSKKMKRNGTLSYLFEYIERNVENMRCLIVLMFEYINKCLEHIYKRGDNHVDPEVVDELTDQMILFLKMIKLFIRIYPDLINCHLVHYIPYVIINIWNSFKEWADDNIVVQMSKILSECAANNDFINYFASLVSTSVREYSKLIFFDVSIVEKRLELFNKLSAMDTEFIDPLQSTFILKVAFMPMSGTDPMLCDKYVIESYLRTKPEHPFTREKMTIDDFKKIQCDLNDVIIAKEAQRRQFVYDNK